MDKVVAVIEFQKMILIGRVKKAKIKSFGGLQYVFPGGAVQEGENLKEAVVRETKEETGLDVKVMEKIGERNHPVTGAKIHYFFCQSHSDITSVNSSENDDLEELLWVESEILKEFMPSLNPSVENYLVGTR